MEAELLVLDDLGAEKTSEWVEETMNLIVNSRYNDRRPTVFTSNYDLLDDRLDPDSLTARVGFRMCSRLHEMCEFLETRGADYRQAGPDASPARPTSSASPRQRQHRRRLHARQVHGEGAAQEQGSWLDRPQAGRRALPGNQAPARTRHAGGTKPWHSGSYLHIPVLLRDLQLLQLQPGPVRPAS